MADQVVLNSRYRILHQIGEGGMAKVYRAEDSLLDRTVAIKVLREQYASDAAFLARFRQEARSAAALAHPNIVSIYDVGVDGSWNYIVMEHVGGPTLKELILQGAPFTTARAVEIASQILSALSFAHQKGVIHRDIKPQNILLSVDGQAKVADFGIALAATGAQLTETGVVLGSVHYFAPEQAKGEAATLASDIYSLGVVMYEMLTGRLPYDADNALGVALKHLQENPQQPSHWNPKIPRALESIILKAMAKEPEHRYVSAELMKQALAGYQQIGDQVTAPIHLTPVQSTTARATVPVPAAQKSGGVNWLVIILAILILGLLAASVPLGYRVYQLYVAPGMISMLAPTAEPAPTSTAAPTSTSTSVPATPTPIPASVVPSVVGKTFDDARRELEALGFRVRKASEEPSDTIAVSRVITQSVGAGREAPPGATVDVVISLGPERLAVPNVTNLRLSDAVAKLVEKQFKPEVREEWHDAVPVDFVFAQKPEPNARLEKGSKVHLTVSRGKRDARKDLIAVPSLVGLSEKDARSVIDSEALTNTYTNYQGRGDIADSELLKVPVGAVISQNPLPGTLVQPGTTVYIAVRKP